MRNKTLTVLAVAAILTLSLRPTRAYAILLDDGQVHNIDMTINDSVEVRDDSFFGRTTTVNLLPSGAIEGDLYAYENSQINVSGGSIGWPKTGNLVADDNSRVTFSAGQISNHLITRGNSQVTFFGGTIGTIVGGLLAFDSSQVTFFSGTIDFRLQASDNSEITVSGGLIGEEIWAGTSSSADAVITFEGSDFAINGTPVSYGEFDTGGSASIHGTLTGTLTNGDFLNNSFYIHGDSSIILIPEPATLFMLGLGAVMLRRKLFR